MSDKKSAKKPTNPKPTADEGNKGGLPTIVDAEGKERPVKSGDVIREKDGKTVVLDKEEAVRDLLSAKGMLVSIGNNELGMAQTYGVSVKRCDNGNLLLSLETSTKSDSEFVMPKPEQCAPGLFLPDKKGVRYIGRRANMEAMFAMWSCYEAYTQNLGLTNAYALVRLELQDIGDGMKWRGLFVPALKVMEA